MQAIKLATLLGVLALLVAIAWASLAGSPFMQSIPWIPDFIAQWADRNPNFRNFPAFALLSAVTFAATYLLTSGLHFKSQVSALTSKTSSFSPIFLALFCAGGVTLLAALLEAMQLALPNRSADWRDILYASLGSLTGSLIPALLLKLPRASVSL